MKFKSFLCVLFLAVTAFATAPSTSKNMGLGGWVQGGNPGEHAGLDFMMREGSNITWDIYLHFYFSDGDNSLGAYFGYYWNYYLPMPQDVGRMGFYFGPVGGLGFWDEEYYWYDEFGIALRVGITGGYQWEFPVIPLQLYLELNPVGEIHFLSWDGHHANDKHDPDYAYRDDSDTQWKMPDFYLRLGLRFWF